LLTYKVENDSLFLVWVDDQFSEPYEVKVFGEINQLKKKLPQGVGFSNYTIQVNGHLSVSEGISLRELKGKYERSLSLEAVYRNISIQRTFTIR
jgi:hypothetical protein